MKLWAKDQIKAYYGLKIDPKTGHCAERVRALLTNIGYVYAGDIEVSTRASCLDIQLTVKWVLDGS